MCMGPLRLRASALCLGAACVLGCGVAAPFPAITSVEPGHAYTDRPLRLTINGEGFIPSFDIDEASGVRRGDVAQFSGRVGSTENPALLHDFGWLDTKTMTATMDPGLVVGRHTVQVIDPRGHSVELPHGFWSFGPDLMPPVLAIQRPTSDTAAGPGSVLDVEVVAADPDPGTLQRLTLDLESGGRQLQSWECPREDGDAHARCELQITVPATLSPGDQLTLHAQAIDDASPPHVVDQSVPLTLLGPPTITSVSPSVGGTAGGTDVVVSGTGFTPGTQIYLGDLLLLPAGGTLLDAQTIVGRTPAHAEALVAAAARSAVGPAQLTDAFSYRSPPLITSIMPEMGAPDGGTAIRVRGTNFTDHTRIYFGDTLVGAAPCESQTFDDDTQISGVAPAGMGHTSVWAHDPDLGWSRLADGFGWSMSP